MIVQNMTIEERLQKIIGAQVFQITALQIALEQAQDKIIELEKPKDDPLPTSS
jgi:hypothetical protein